MDNQEANKIIAEFMGNKCGSLGVNWYKYHLSLDALVPVWEKIGRARFDYNICLSSYPENMFEFSANPCEALKSSIIGLSKSSIQKAAAIATAKAILELTKENKTWNKD